MHPVQAVRHDMLAAHCSFFFEVFFVGYCHAGNGNFQRYDGVFGLGEGNLNRPTYLAGVYFSGHYCAKCPNVKEILTHPLRQFLSLFVLFLAAFSQQVQSLMLHKLFCADYSGLIFSCM